MATAVRLEKSFFLKSRSQGKGRERGREKKRKGENSVYLSVLCVSVVKETKGLRERESEGVRERIGH